MFVPQLVFFPSAAIAARAAIFSPRWIRTASYPKVSQIAVVYPPGSAFNEPFFTVKGSNLTPDRETGIGARAG
jgi:hypothetical protein